MKKRILTGVVYVIVIAACILLKAFIPSEYGAIAFDVLFTAVTAIGSFEFLRAANIRSRLQRSIAQIFGVIIVPVYAAVKYLGVGNGQYFIMALFAIACFAIFIAFVFDNAHAAFNDTAKSVFCTVYVGLMGVLLASCNHMEYNSLAAMMLIFICTPVTDTFAFLIGSALGKRFPKKLAPELSPNKTVVGSVGGLIGGIVGSLAVYGLFVLFGGEYYATVNIPALAAFLIIGAVIGVFGQVGDLFESAVKRAFGVKDMGKILPGHGGMLDRFDSALFAGVVVFALFWLLTAF